MVQTDWDSITESLDTAAGHGANAHASHHNSHDSTSAGAPTETRTQLDPEPLPSTRFAHPPLVIRQTPVVHADHSTSIWQRRRSRSPITHPSLYRDRSQDSVSPRHQRSATHDFTDSGHGPDEFDVHEDPSKSEPVAAKRPPVEHPHLLHYHTNLSLPEVQAEKNKFSICVYCWLKDLPCDGKWPCRECKTMGKSCAYIACPLRMCLLETKCPAYHVLPGLPHKIMKIGSHMHLVALLNLERRSLDSYDMERIKEMLQDIRNSQNIYRRVEDDIERAIEQGKRIDDTTVRKMIKESDKVPYMGARGVKAKTRFIVTLVKEMKKQPFLELWEHDRRQRKLGPQISDAMDLEGTPILGLEE